MPPTYLSPGLSQPRPISAPAYLSPDLSHGAIVKPDVTIGAGAVIASGAVVTKDVPPYMIMAGIPAVPLRERFPRAVVDWMLALAW